MLRLRLNNYKESSLNCYDRLQFDACDGINSCAGILGAIRNAADLTRIAAVMGPEGACCSAALASDLQPMLRHPQGREWPAVATMNLPHARQTVSAPMARSTDP